MHKYDLIVFIKCSGPNIRRENLAETIKTFSETNKNLNYGLYLSVDKSLEKLASKVIKHLEIEEKLLELNVCRQPWWWGVTGVCLPGTGGSVAHNTYTESWAKDYNKFFEKYKNLTKWILISHDDVAFLTENYFQKILDRVAGHEKKIGWITSNSLYYPHQEGKVVQDILRPGYYLDFDCGARGGAMFHLHKFAKIGQLAKKMNLKDSSSLVMSNRTLIDLPERAAKVHGIQSAIMIISTESMKKVGCCEDWTNYTMLIDEDWSLTALKNNLWNVFIPDVYHTHPLRRHLRRTDNKWEREAHHAFKKKWGFDVCENVITKQMFKQGISMPVKELQQEYKNTNIPWSTYRKSYEWEYLDEGD